MEEEEKEEKERFRGMFAAAEKEVDRIWTETVKKLKKRKGGDTSSTSATAGVLSVYEDVRWFIMAADFPLSLPTITTTDSANDSPSNHQTLPLKGMEYA